MPRIYGRYDRGTTKEPHTTFYQVFVGKGAAFEGTRGLKLAEDFPDGTSNTILIVEAGEAVPWTKPDDLPYAADRPLPGPGRAVQGDHPGRPRGRLDPLVREGHERGDHPGRHHPQRRRHASAPTGEGAPAGEGALPRRETSDGLGPEPARLRRRRGSTTPTRPQRARCSVKPATAVEKAKPVK